MMSNAYGRADQLHRAATEEEFEMGGQNDETEHVYDDVDYENMVRESTTPVYKGSRENRLQSGIVLMTLASVYRVSDAFLSALLTYLTGTLLPRSNCLPRTAFKLKNMVRKLGLVSLK